MKKLIVLMITLAVVATAENITIQISNNAGPLEKLAASELQRYLADMYPRETFELKSTVADGKVILLGVADNLELSQKVLEKIPTNNEGFLIQQVERDRAVLTSTGELGVLHAVYQLLEKFGYGFFLSFESKPKSQNEFSFDEWNLNNEPLFPERYVFNWHNFLSGCTGWDFEQWHEWIVNSQKMGYNKVMVHAYGNNPIFDFTMNGESKPVGYLTSSVKGRDWSTDHVNDVRRLPGGEIFDDAIFGSSAAKVPDDQRTSAVQNLMKDVFDVAENRGMQLNFAIDFDVLSNIPQNVVMTLPEHDRFQIMHEAMKWMGEPSGDVWLVRPDTPGGYDYYKLQVERLFDLYPQIDELTLWRRTQGTTWLNLKTKDVPKAWRSELENVRMKNADIDTLRQFVGNFAIAKLVDCYRQILDEMGRDDVQLSMGTWTFKDIEVQDRLLPDYLKIIRLDSDILPWRGDWDFQNQETIDYLGDTFPKGRVQPIIWAHHDDGTYYGSPLAIFENFSDRLERSKANGFGIIHWMTRPFDLFFVNHSRQTWKNTKNESLKETCDFSAARMFPDHAKVMSAYLQRWYDEMPSFGRETSFEFIDRPLDYSTIAKGRERVAFLKELDISKMDQTAQDHYNYFLGLEEWTLHFLQTQEKFEITEKLIKEGDVQGARVAMSSADPEKVLDDYSQFITNGGSNRSEEGLLFSMGLRWLPHFSALRQQLQLDAVYYNFGITRHGELAQARGLNTYYIDERKQMWKTFGEKETGFQPVKNDPHKEILSYAISIPAHSKIDLTLWNGGDFPSGNYKLELYGVSSEGLFLQNGKDETLVGWGADENIKPLAFQLEQASQLKIFNTMEKPIQLSAVVVAPQTK